MSDMNDERLQRSIANAKEGVELYKQMIERRGGAVVPPRQLGTHLDINISDRASPEPAPSDPQPQPAAPREMTREEFEAFKERFSHLRQRYEHPETIKPRRRVRSPMKAGLTLEHNAKLRFTEAQQEEVNYRFEVMQWLRDWATNRSNVHRHQDYDNKLWHNRLVRELTRLRNEYEEVRALPYDLARQVLSDVAYGHDMTRKFPYRSNVQFVREHGRNLLAIQFPDELGVVEVDAGGDRQYESWLASKPFLISAAEIIWFRSQEGQPYLRFDYSAVDVAAIANKMLAKGRGSKLTTKQLKDEVHRVCGMWPHEREIAQLMHGARGWTGPKQLRIGGSKRQGYERRLTA